MASEEIEISIGKTGEVEIRTIGIKGPRCLDVAEALARIIGQEQSRELTQEYYEVQQQTHGQVNVKRTP
jgi:hypothetical protein